jgi:hypothetical protein
MFKVGFEKTALDPKKLETRLQEILKHKRFAGKAAKTQALNAADEYRIARSTGQSALPHIHSLQKQFPKLAALKPFTMSRGRITPTLIPGNPVKGLKGLTGAQAATPFNKAVGRFGHKPRQALVAKSNVRANDGT